MRDGLLRENQEIRGSWRAYGFIAPEGWGKSYAIAAEFTRRVFCHAESGTPASTPHSLSVVAATRSALSGACAALRGAAPPWARPQGVSGLLEYPYKVVITTCSLDVASFAPRAPGTVWLVDLGGWSEKHADTFEHVRNASDMRILWDATSEASTMAKTLADETTPGYRVERGVGPPSARAPGFIPQT